MCSLRHYIMHVNLCLAGVGNMYRKYKESCADQCTTHVTSAQDSDVTHESEASTISQGAGVAGSGSGHSSVQNLQGQREDPVKQTVEKCWSVVEEQLQKVPAAATTPTRSRRSWNNVRIFVSSTFADCHSEREVLVKQVCALYII